MKKHVRQGDVESARLKEKTVSFRLKGDAAHYRVENPLAPDFKEKLLLSGVRVEDETGRDPLSYGMDMTAIGRPTPKSLKRVGLMILGC